MATDMNSKKIIVIMLDFNYFAGEEPSMDEDDACQIW